MVRDKRAECLVISFVSRGFRYSVKRGAWCVVRELNTHHALWRKPNDSNPFLALERPSLIVYSPIIVTVVASWSATGEMMMVKDSSSRVKESRLVCGESVESVST